MKTNQLLRVAFSQGEIEIFHKTAMGSLTDLIRVGNKYRMNKDITPFEIRSFLKQKETRAYIDSVCKIKGLTEDEVVKVRGRGRASKTYANLFLLIYVAERLDSDFHVEVVDTFINSKILTLRDQGGNDFKKLNVAIDKLSDRTRDLKPKGNKGCYMNIAKLLRAKIFSSTDIELYGNNSNIWNSPIATAEKQLLRTDYESRLVMFIDAGFVTTYLQLKDTILNKL